jgi:ADYC domain
MAVLVGMSLAISISERGQAAEPAAMRSIAAEATQFRLTLADRRVLRSPDLVGANLVIATPGGTARIRIEAVERDPDAKSGEVWLHTMLTEQPDGSWANMCDAGPDGRRQGFPTASHMRPDGSVEITPPEQFELVCTAGVRGKCVRWGYRPWEPSELALYGACTRMARADYCGDAVATTRNGTLIDMYDDRRIETPDNDPTQEFEAGWTPRGAVCVRHARIKENITLERLVAVCPRLAGKVGEMCTEDVARSLGAALFNRSKP